MTLTLLVETFENCFTSRVQIDISRFRDFFKQWYQKLLQSQSLLSNIVVFKGALCEGNRPLVEFILQTIRDRTGWLLSMLTTCLQHNRHECLWYNINTFIFFTDWYFSSIVFFMFWIKILTCCTFKARVYNPGELASELARFESGTSSKSPPIPPVLRPKPRPRLFSEESC